MSQTASNPKPAGEPYTREEIAEELKNRDSKPQTYDNMPQHVETAYKVQESQLDAQGNPIQGQPPQKKKGGIRGLFSRDHGAKAERELRQERAHAEKAERYAAKARDPGLTDRQRKRWLRKTAQQQAAADFHESLKKKHLIAGTPGHKDQAVPAMATHHPIVHDNTTNTITSTVADQNTQNRNIGTPAFDGISEVGSAQKAAVPHPVVAVVPTHVQTEHYTPSTPPPISHDTTGAPAYHSTGPSSVPPGYTVQGQSFDDDSSSSDDNRNWEAESDSGRSGDDDNTPHRQVYKVKQTKTTSITPLVGTTTVNTTSGTTTTVNTHPIVSGNFTPIAGPTTTVTNPSVTVVTQQTQQTQQTH